jgi:hypothetical protein
MNWRTTATFDGSGSPQFLTTFESVLASLTRCEGPRSRGGSGGVPGFFRSVCCLARHYLLDLLTL